MSTPDERARDDWYGIPHPQLSEQPRIAAALERIADQLTLANKLSYATLLSPPMGPLTPTTVTRGSILVHAHHVLFGSGHE